MFYARVIFTVKTILDSLSLEIRQVWTSTVLADCIYEMKRITESGQQGSKLEDNVCCTSTLGELSTNWESNSKIPLVSAGFPLPSPSTISRGY